MSDIADFPEIKDLFLPKDDSHKGQNGRLLIIGGSHLFHAASLWALKVASRIVDLVHYSSIPENNRIVQKLKEEFRDGIVVPREEIENYIEEDDCILIGPGMVRTEGRGLGMINSKLGIKNIKEINDKKDEGLQTYYLTKYLLRKYPHKRWVIDAGALQMLDLNDIPENAILTPHLGEFEGLEAKNSTLTIKNKTLKERVKNFAFLYKCIVLLKGKVDIVACGDKVKEIKGGNAGMTKGGTGDVLAGLVAGIYCKNNAWLSAVTASFINKKSSEELFETKGYWYNASDLADQIPKTMKQIIL